MESLRYFTKVKQRKSNRQRTRHRIHKLSVALAFCMLISAITMCSELAYAQTNNKNIIESQIEATETGTKELVTLEEDKTATPPRC